MCFTPKIQQAPPPPEPLEKVSSAPVSAKTARKRKRGGAEPQGFLLPSDVQVPK